MQVSDLHLHLPHLERAIERRILSVTPDMAVPAVIKQMSQIRTCCAFVVEGDRLVGVLTERDIVRLTAVGVNLSDTEIAAVMIRKVMTLIQSESENVLTALALLKQHRIRYLPVVDPQGRLIGVVTPTSIRHALQPDNLLKGRQVGDAMTTQVIHAPPTATLLSLVELMTKRQVSCVVIVEEITERGGGEEEHGGRGMSGGKKNDSPAQRLIPVGIVTERDVVRFQALGLDLAQTQAQTVMSSPLIPVHPEDSLWKAHREMQHRHLHRFVITGEHGELVGIITQTNLLRVLDITEMYGAVGELQQLVDQRTAELSRINQSLINEVAERQLVEGMLRRTQTEIEQRVKDRTAELTVANQKLAQEVQERQEAESALQENYSLLRSIIDATPDAVFFKDVQGCYQLINQSGARLFSQSIEAIIGLTDADLFPAEVAARIKADDQKLLASAQSITFEETVSVQGEFRHYLTTKTVHHDSQGAPLGIVVFAREITQLKQIQQTLSQVNQNLEQANKQLEHRVWERTAALRGVNQQLIQEVAERRALQESLDRKNAEFEAILKAIPDALIFADKDRHMRLLNPAFTQMFGYSADEVRGRHTRILYANVDDYEVQGRSRFNLDAEARLKPYEVSCRRRNGRVFVSETVDTAVKDSQGKALGFLAIIRDISERKQAEAELWQYQDRLEQMVESRTAELTQANQLLHQEITERQQIEATLKYQAELEELISEISNQFINLNPDAVDQGIETALEAISEFMHADRGHVILRPNQSKTSQCVYAWCVSGIEPTQLDLTAGLLGAHAPWLDRQLQRVGVVRIGSLSDLPPEASAEKALCQSDGIQSLVAVRIVYANSLLGLLSIESVRSERDWSERDVTRLRMVAEIFASALEHRRSQDALVERTRDLERSNADLEQFAYVASHDLQEPLRAVTSYGQLLSKRYAGRLDARANKYIGYIVDGGNRMQQLIQDLLNYSRVGKRRGTFQLISGDQVLEKVLDNLAIAIAQSSSAVTSDPLPQVMADEGQLIQLLQNLLSNAIKFKGEESPKIHISAIRYTEGRWRTRDGTVVSDPPGVSHRLPGRWLFFVRDNGIGIEPEYTERIFTLFQRLHTRKQYPGTGIGLAVCKKIVERHGGQIWVKSDTGQGTIFYFTLPFLN